MRLNTWSEIYPQLRLQTYSFAPHLQVQAHDVRNTMEQFWFTPEAEGWTDEERQLLNEFREALCECNPFCDTYVRACDLRDDPRVEHHDVTLEFKHGDSGGPEVSAFVQTANADKLPPQLQCVAWEAGKAQPRSKPVHGGMGDALTYTALFPTGFGVMLPGQTRAICFANPADSDEEHHNQLAVRRLTVPQHTRFLLYQMPPTFRCDRRTAVLFANCNACRVRLVLSKSHVYTSCASCGFPESSS